MPAQTNTAKKSTQKIDQQPRSEVPPHSTAVHVLGPKGGIGKSTLSRLTIDLFDASSRAVKIVQVDRAPALPAIYPNRTETIDVPTSQAMREDPLAAMRAFEPWEAIVETIANKPAGLITDVGGGPNARAFMDFIARARVDGFLQARGIRVIAFVLLTPDPAVMEQSADLAAELTNIHPHAEIVVVFNQRDGGFKFYPGSPADKVYRARVEPLIKSRRHLVMPAIAAGAWPVFEAAGMTFLQVAMADENDLVEKLGLSRAMAASLQGDVSAFLAVMWPRLGSLIGFSMEALNGKA